MKQIQKAALATLTLMAMAGTQAQSAASTYILTITNGSQMPLSPIVAYVKNGQAAKSHVGVAPTTGFIQLCQTGNPATRFQELGMASDVTFKTQTMGLLMPGESRTVEVEVKDPMQQSVQVETMYGKTKDTCAVGSIGGHSLYALQQHVTSEYIGKDNVLQTGAFQDPAIPTGHNYLDMSVCAQEMDAVSCLRHLAAPSKAAAKIRFFSPYLSSVQMLIEDRFGAAETQSLIIPSSGAVEFSLKLKH